MRALGFMLAAVGAIALLPLHAVTAQDIPARLLERVPANMVDSVQRIAQDAAAHGLPVEPLLLKAIEGSAKSVSAERVIAAVRVLAARLGESRNALREAGIPAPSPEAVESGADALNAGLNASQVRDLGRVSRPPYDPVVTLQVVAALTALGVPAPQGVRLMAHMIHAGREPKDLLELPNEVQISMARGATAAEAAEGLDAAQGGQGPQGQQGQQGEGNNPRKP